MRAAATAAVALVALPRPAAAADKDVRAFIGVTFAGSTTFVDLEKAAGKPNVVIGADAVVLGEIVGVEVDIARAPGFFQSGGQHLVLHSSVTTLTGNVIVAMPRRLTEYTLRPYFVAGAGAMFARSNDVFDVLRVHENPAAWDIGGGVVGFITNRFGVAWDVRRFSSFRGSSQVGGVSFGAAQLSFWRANMAIAIRY